MGIGQSKPIDYAQQLLEDKTLQCDILEEGEEKNCSRTRRMKGFGGGIKGKMFEDDDDTETVETLHQLLEFTSRKNGDKRAFGTQLFPEEKDGERGDYVWVDYTTFTDEVKWLGKGFRCLGIEPQGNVGIFSINRAEWSWCSWATFTQSMRTVALYDTLGAEAIDYICGHAELQVVCCSKDKLKKVFAVKKDNAEIPLKHIIQFDYDERYNNKFETIDDADRKEAADLGIEIHGLSEIIQKGKDSDFEVVAPRPEDLAFLMYTSGTTGLPKGVMLSHGNLIATCTAAENVIKLTSEDTHISYLTLAHIFETAIHVLVFAVGGKIGFFQGDFKKIVDDFSLLQPTILCGVPRVFQRLYDRVMGTAAEAACIKRYFFHKYLKASANAANKGERVDSADQKVWIPARTKMGLAKVRVIVSGAAPLPPFLLEFLKVVVGCPVIQGYGLTETAAAATVSQMTDLTAGHCGPPLSCCEVKLVDVPDMNYTSTDEPCPRGEVWLRGPNVFQGYYKNDEVTAKVFPDNDGFFATGDIGRWNHNGTLSIIDRKKNIFKLSQGEYIAAEKIEGLYNKASAVNQIWVYGNSYKSFVIGVVVPSVGWVLSEAKAKYPAMVADLQQLQGEDLNEGFHNFCKRHYEDVKALVLADMRQYEQDLKGFEKVRDILVETELDELQQGFHVENDTMTPSFKLKRPQLTKRYVAAIKDVYTANGQAPRNDEKWGGE